MTLEAPPALAPWHAASVSGVHMPPRGFRAAEGVRSAWLLASGPFSARTPKTACGRTPAQRLGLAYEKKWHAYIQSRSLGVYHAGPWIGFATRGGSRTCQPDGFLQMGKVGIIFEVKSRLVSDAWWQLRHLYAPVVRLAYGVHSLGLCVVCRHADPLVVFPEPFRVCPALDVADLLLGDEVKVVSWTP